MLTQAPEHALARGKSSWDIYAEATNKTWHNPWFDTAGSVQRVSDVASIQDEREEAETQVSFLTSLGMEVALHHVRFKCQENEAIAEVNKSICEEAVLWLHLPWLWQEASQAAWGSSQPEDPPCFEETETKAEDRKWRHKAWLGKDGEIVTWKAHPDAWTLGEAIDPYRFRKPCRTHVLRSRRLSQIRSWQNGTRPGLITGLRGFVAQENARKDREEAVISLVVSVV